MVTSYGGAITSYSWALTSYDGRVLDSYSRVLDSYSRVGGNQLGQGFRQCHDHVSAIDLQCISCLAIIVNL